MNLRQARCEFTMLIPKLIDKAIELGYEICLDEGTNHQGKGHRPGSLHYDGCAQDINLYLEGVYIIGNIGHQDLGPYWVSLHSCCRWGGNFKNEKGELVGDWNHYSFSPRELFGDRK